jgi:hypothetical protein
VDEFYGTAGMQTTSRTEAISVGLRRQVLLRSGSE